MSRHNAFRLACLAIAVALALLGTGAGNVTAQSKEKPAPLPIAPNSAQVIPGYPLTISVLDNTQMSIQYTNSLVGLSTAQQFYSDYADAIYVWAQHDVQSPRVVFGPATMPGGHSVTPYTSISNELTGVGTAADPWVITTINDVPGTKFRLTQHTTYVNGAEYVKLHFHLEQMGGTEALPVTLFHAADLTTARTDGLGVGYHNGFTGAIGDYVENIEGRTVYQQFIPNEPASHVLSTNYQESTYEALWDNIGDANGPGPGLDGTIVDQLHDTAIGLQWDLSVPEVGDVSFGDTAFFGPHEYLSGSFIDVAAENYCYDYVYNMGVRGIAKGYPDGTFRPSENVTRGQLAKMMVLAMGWPIDTTGGPHFNDVAFGSTFYDYIETAFNRHIITGYPDRTFNPGGVVTRGQAMKFVVLAKGWEIDTTAGPHFSDVAVGSTFYDYIETANNHGIISGYDDGTFRPGNSTLRGQVSKILDRSGLLQ